MLTPDYLGMILIPTRLPELREPGDSRGGRAVEAATSNVLAVLAGLLLLWSYQRFTRLVFSPFTVTMTSTVYARLLAWAGGWSPPAPADTASRPGGWRNDAEGARPSSEGHDTTRRSQD